MSNLDWPRGTMACDGGHEERARAAERMQRAHERAWAQHESVKTLLRRHFPADWERVKACRVGEHFDYKTRTHEDQPNLVMLRPECRDRPFCPACNDVATWNRARGFVNKLREATPRGKSVNGYLVTLGVSARDDEHRELLELVAGDERAIKRAAYRTVERMYGDGIGAVLSYQHYGQDVLLRVRPHVHVMVNGYRLNDAGKPVRTKMFQLKDGGKGILEGYWHEELCRAYPAAGGRPPDDWFSGHETNVEFMDGRAAVAHAAKYVAREIIDFRDFEYDPRKRIVYVTPYKEQGPGVLCVETLQRNLSIYNARFQPWSGRHGRRVFDGAYGDFSDRRAQDTRIAMGAVAAHREGCWCHECSDWGRIMQWRIEGEPTSIDEAGPAGWV